MFIHVFHQSISIRESPKDDWMHLFNLNTLVCPPRQLIDKFSKWKFDESLLKELPIDPEKRNFVRRDVAGSIFSQVPVTSIKSPLIVAISKDALRDILDIKPEVSQESLFVDFINGKYNPENALNYAHRYGGHQFGSWAEQLGDGRANLLGDRISNNGIRWEYQLKGSGRTPYSRDGDGKAVLRSSIREFLCSEAMHYLNVPTSRAAVIISSEETAMRDQFYDGHPKREKVAIVLRLAESWFRIGSLEILTKRKEFNLLRKLTDFIIRNHFKSIREDNPDKYIIFFNEVVNSTAFTIAKWISIGFAHGVCNTDNINLLGLTIDYGPFGFLDSYNPGWTPNTSDDEHRYAFNKQAFVGSFNLIKLREALLPIISREKYAIIKNTLNGFYPLYTRYINKLYCEKLALIKCEKEDEHIINQLLKMMEDRSADYTMTFRQLPDIRINVHNEILISNNLWAIKSLSDHVHFEVWARKWLDRLEGIGLSLKDAKQKMDKVNPRYILRNWVLQEAIGLAENGDYSRIETLMKIFKNPYKMQKIAEDLKLANKPPRWAKTLRVSCSS